MQSWPEIEWGPHMLSKLVSPPCFIPLSTDLLSGPVWHMKQQLTCFVNHCTATQREAGFLFSSSRITMEGTDWVKGLGSGSFLWWPVSNGKRQKPVTPPWHITITVYHLWLGKITDKVLLKQIWWQEAYCSHLALCCIPATPRFLAILPETQDVSVLTSPAPSHWANHSPNRSII